MSSESGGFYKTNFYYIKISIYKSKITNNYTKNILPYGLSIQYDNQKPKFIKKIKTIDKSFDYTIFNFVNYDINNIYHTITINAFNSFGNKKKYFAFFTKRINITNINGKNKNWYNLKNSNDEIIIKVLLSIKLYQKYKKEMNITSFNDKYYLSYNKTFFPGHKDLISSNNSIQSNNIYISNNNEISNTIINYTSKNIILNNNKLILSGKKEKKKDAIKSLIKKNNNNNNISYENNIVSEIQNMINYKFQNLNQDYRLLMKKRQILLEEENLYYKTKKYVENEESKLQKEKKVMQKSEQEYENKFLKLVDNYHKNEINFNKAELEKEINNYQKDIFFNLNNINNINQISDKNILDKKKQNKDTKEKINYNGKYKKSECSIFNFSHKDYSFESYNLKNNINSNKFIFNILFENKNKFYQSQNNFGNFKKSVISNKIKDKNREFNIKSYSSIYNEKFYKTALNKLKKVGGCSNLYYFPCCANNIDKSNKKLNEDDKKYNQSGKKMIKGLKKLKENINSKKVKKVIKSTLNSNEFSFSHASKQESKNKILQTINKGESERKRLIIIKNKNIKRNKKNNIENKNTISYKEYKKNRVLKNIGVMTSINLLKNNKKEEISSSITESSTNKISSKSIFGRNYIIKKSKSNHGLK